MVVECLGVILKANLTTYYSANCGLSDSTPKELVVLHTCVRGPQQLPHMSVQIFVDLRVSKWPNLCPNKYCGFGASGRSVDLKYESHCAHLSSTPFFFLKIRKILYTLHKFYTMCRQNIFV